MPNDIEGYDGDSRPVRPIFVMGILPRCGTNFLSDLLCLHPDCAPPAPIWEDFFLFHANLLDRYVDRVFGSWDRRWGVGHETRDRLLAHLGSGLTSFLTEQSGATRVVTKTPRVENLDRFFELFPDAHLLILIRDGRSVLESGIRSFGWNREWALHKWAEAADRIIEFDREHGAEKLTYRIVQYENLCDNLATELPSILEFLGLDASAYDLEAAAGLPVRGSSTIRDRGSGMHWEPVEKGAGFDPTQRFGHWNAATHARFNWVARRQLERLGYTPDRATSAGVLWTAWNLILDLKWLAIRLIGPMYLKLKRR